MDEVAESDCFCDACAGCEWATGHFSRAQARHGSVAFDPVALMTPESCSSFMVPDATGMPFFNMVTRCSVKLISDEEKRLARSWLHVTQDQKVGTGQTSVTCWGKVSSFYNSNRDPDHPERPQRSLESKWASIRAHISKFIGCLACVEDLKISGISDVDELTKAKELFRSNSSVNGKPERKLAFIECWRILKDCPKFTTSHRSVTEAKPFTP